MSRIDTIPSSPSNAEVAALPEQDAPNEGPTLAGAGGPLRCLVVIDDQPPVHAYRSIARKLGVEVIFVERAQDALRTVLRERPAGVILDLRLPDGDGRDLLALFKQSPEIADIPVVIVSGCLRPFEENTCFDLGAAGVAEKPVAIRRVMEQAMGLRAVPA